MKEENTTEIIEPIIEPMDDDSAESAVNPIQTMKEIAETTQNMVPKLDPAQEFKPLIEDEKLLDVYEEVLNNIRQDRVEVSDFINNLAEAVMNGGDATSSTKEALVNLIKIKNDTSDKMSKIADLMTRARGVNTMPRWLAAQQNNTFNIGAGGPPKKVALTMEEKRKLIERENNKVQE